MKFFKKYQTELKTNSTDLGRPISSKFILRTTGWLALSIPTLMPVGAALLNKNCVLLSSISAYYYTGMRNFFVGILFAISLAMFAYKGYHKHDGKLGNLAAIFTLGVAIFPTNICTSDYSCLVAQVESSWISVIHYISAGLLFSVLAILCLVYFSLTRNDMERKVYNFSGFIILFCITFMVIYTLLIGEGKYPRLDNLNPIFVGETISLFAFGIAWLTKSELFTSQKNRSS